VSAFSISDGAGLTQLGTVPSGGINPVHLSVHSSGRWLVVANYTGATASVLPIGADGALSEASHVVALTGPSGPDPVEQRAPHPHDIPFDPSSTFVAVPDKGLDRVFVFGLDTQTGKFVAASPPFVQSAPGAGPRHIAFHPRQSWAYVINELNSTISSYSYRAGGDGFSELQTLSSLPEDVDVNSTGSEIVVHPSGTFVYVSNRGHNSVGVFSIDSQNGSLTPIDWYPTRGDTPRVIALDPAGRFVYAANQDSDTIVTFSVDTSTGRLSETGQVLETGSPVSIVFRAEVQQ
jgi:6-phosphogluconolactonase (cycloisomerase 2 family)